MEEVIEMTKWDTGSQKIFGTRNPGEAPRPDQQGSLNIVTLIVAVVCYAGLIILGIAAELGMVGWFVAGLMMLVLSMIDVIYGHYRQAKQQRKFYWQLFLARSSIYGYAAITIVMILHCV